MPLQAPRLDDRTYTDIAAEARRRIPLYCPEWTDHNASDPGITLIELFAWMTDIVLYRLNRVPEKHYVKFMELIGMRLREAEPAHVPVTFWLSAPQPTSITIPAGAQVATTRTEMEPAIIFSTDDDFEVRVPKLISVLTSKRRQDGHRGYTAQNVRRLELGYEGFSTFADKPQPDDALYLGFEEDLSQHILGITLDVDVAGGAGIDPTRPPYVWEAHSRDDAIPWAEVEVESDATRGFNVPGMIRLHLPQMKPTDRNNQVAYWLRCRLAPAEGVASYRESPRIRQLTVASWGGTVNCTHVTTVRGEVMGRSDGSPGQRFELEHKPVLPRTEAEHLAIRLPDGRMEGWAEVEDFASSGPEDRHYTLDSSMAELRLGPALPQRDGSVRCYGAIPPRGAMLIMTAYRHGGGHIGNVTAGALNVLKSGLPYIDRVSNRQSAQGGLDAEDLDDAKLRVPGHLRSLNRAVTARDYEYLAEEAVPGQVGRVHCLQPPRTNLGEVKVLVIPRVAQAEGFIAPDLLNLPADLQQQITAYLDERRLISTRLEVLAPAYQWVSTRVRLRASAFADPDEVRGRVSTRLFTLINPLLGGIEGTGWGFGRDLFASDVMAALLTVPGVEFVRSVELFPVAYSRGQFQRGDATQEIPIVAHGVAVSHEHDVLLE